MSSDGDRRERERELPQADALGTFWNELVRGAPAPPADLDPALAETVRRLHAMRSAPRLPKPTQQRIWEDLMATWATSGPPLTIPPSHTGSRNGRSTGTPHAAGMLFPPRRQWPLAHLATAALILLTLVGGFAIGAHRPRPEADAPVVIPAPVSTPEASPTVPELVVTQLWDTGGGRDTDLDGPYGMTVAPDGNLWVVDANNGRFQIFAPDGTFLETWGTEGSGEDQFNFHPYDEFVGGGGYGDIVFDGQGNFYVADTGNFRIQKFGPDRAFLRQWGSKGTGDGQFLDVLSVAVGPDGNVYAADENRNDVQRFDADGRFLNTIGEEGAGEGQMVDTEAVAVDVSNVVWVADFASPGRIERFTPDGKVLGTWRHDEGDGSLRGPVDLAFDAAGRVWVVDILRQRVLVYTPDGRYLTAISHASTKTAPVVGFSGPVGLALGPDGHVYVGDWFSNFVTAFQVQPAGAVGQTGQTAAATSTATSSTPVSSSATPAAASAASAGKTLLNLTLTDSLLGLTLADHLNFHMRSQMDVYQYAPGGSSTVTAGDGPTISCVADGSLTVHVVTAAHPLRLIAPGATGAEGAEELVAEGQRATLPTDTKLVAAPGSVYSLENNGTTPAQLLGVLRSTAAGSKDLGGVTWQWASTGGLVRDLAPPISVLLRQVTLAPNQTLSAPASPDADQSATPLDPQRISELRVGSDDSLRNAGVEPLETYVLIVQGGAPADTPVT